MRRALSNTVPRQRKVPSFKQATCLRKAQSGDGFPIACRYDSKKAGSAFPAFHIVPRQSAGRTVDAKEAVEEEKGQGDEENKANGVGVRVRVVGEAGDVDEPGEGEVERQPHKHGHDDDGGDRPRSRVFYDRLYNAVQTPSSARYFASSASLQYTKCPFTISRIVGRSVE